MQIIVSDTSVIIDIENSNLTEAMFSLPCQFIVPDILFKEELAQQHSHLIKLGLVQKSLDGELIQESIQLGLENKKLSSNDLFAFALARSKKCLLLTSDKALRDLAENYGVNVHGTLWLVKKMVDECQITSTAAIEAFKKMTDAGSYLPPQEINKMKAKWQTSPLPA